MTPETPRHTIRPGGLDALGNYVDQYREAGGITPSTRSVQKEGLAEAMNCYAGDLVNEKSAPHHATKPLRACSAFFGNSPSVAAKMSAMIVGILLWFMSAAIPAMAGAPVQGAIDPSLPLPQRCVALGALSAQLLETAESGKGHAPSFRIDVVHYREALRILLTDNEKLPAAERLPRLLVLDMVRMVALLQSAAECQTGRYIVCPPDLMDKLRQQQAAVDKGLAAMPTRLP